jgi:hypothetical protein
MCQPCLSALDPINRDAAATRLSQAALPRNDGRPVVSCLTGRDLSRWLLGDALRIVRTADLVGLAPDLPYAQLVVQTAHGATFLFDIRRPGWATRRAASMRARLAGLRHGYLRAALPGWLRF